MILEIYMKTDEKSNKATSNLIEDGITEINIGKEEVIGMRADGSIITHNKKEPLLHSMYLLNDEGKTLKQIYLN